jgi:hypothetical protein
MPLVSSLIDTIIAAISLRTRPRKVMPFVHLLHYGWNTSGTTGEHYLPGERTLRTGSPTGGRSSLADAGISLYLAAALVAIAILGPRWLRDMPGIFKVGGVIVWVCAAAQALGTLVNLLVI